MIKNLLKKKKFQLIDCNFQLVQGNAKLKYNHFRQVKLWPYDKIEFFFFF